MHLRRILAFAVLSLLAGCGGRSGGGAGGPSGPASIGAPAPSGAVERFLRLVESKGYREMGSVFGTEAGPVSSRDDAGDVEQRMYTIASILEHDRFVIRNEQPVPGRLGIAVRMMVDVTRGGRTYQVPFVAVKATDRWLVESMELERITNNP